MRTLGVTNATPYAAAPAVGSAGDTYWNTALKQLFVSDGTSWVASTPSTTIVAWTQQDNTPLFAVDIVGTTEEVATNMQLSVPVTSGRTYRIGFGGSVIGSVTNENWLLTINGWNNGGAAVTTSDLGTATPLMTQRVRCQLGQGQQFFQTGFWTATATGTWRFAISMVRGSGSGTGNVLGTAGASNRYCIPFYVEAIVPGTGGGVLNLDDLGDTVISGPTNGQVVTYESSSGLWKNMAAAGGGGLTDGDKGDITVGGGGTTLTIDPDAVTYPKMQNVSATDRLLGRATSGAGDVEEIVCTAAARSLLDDAATSNMRSTLGLVINTDVYPWRKPLNTTVSAPTFPPASSYENNTVLIEGAGAIAIQMPSDGTAVFPVGSVLDFVWNGASTTAVTITAGAGATVNGGAGPFSLSGRYAKATAVKVSSNTWVVNEIPLAGANGAATETAVGNAELATTAETLAGTDDARIVTPLKLEQKINATITVTSTAPSSPSIGDVWIDTT